MQREPHEHCRARPLEWDALPEEVRVACEERRRRDEERRRVCRAIRARLLLRGCAASAFVSLGVGLAMGSGGWLFPLLIAGFGTGCAALVVAARLGHLAACFLFIAGAFSVSMVCVWTGILRINPFFYFFAILLYAVFGVVLALWAELRRSVLLTSS